MTDTRTLEEIRIVLIQAAGYVDDQNGSHTHTKRFSSIENYSVPVALKRGNPAEGLLKRPPLGPTRVSASGARRSPLLSTEVGNLRLRAAEPLAQGVSGGISKPRPCFHGRQISVA